MAEMVDCSDLDAVVNFVIDRTSNWPQCLRQKLNDELNAAFYISTEVRSISMVASTGQLGPRCFSSWIGTDSFPTFPC